MISTTTGAALRSCTNWRVQPFTCARQQSRPPRPHLSSCSCTADSEPTTGTGLISRRELLNGLPLAVAVVACTSAPVQAKTTAGDWSSPGLATPEDDDQPKFFKTASGAKVQQLTAGSGPEAKPGDSVLLDYVLRRANGYFIYSTVEGVSFQPRDIPIGPVAFKLGSGQLIPGLEEAVVGMQQGGKRRVLVPPEVGYTLDGLEPQPPTFATKRQLENHKREPLLFEIELLKVRS